MSNKPQIQNLFLLFLAGVITFTSCKKDESATTAAVLTETVTSSNTIAVALVTSPLSKSSAGSTDSIYVMHSCARGYVRDSITASDLPASVTSYLSSNYAGYTFQAAYKVINRDSAVGGYVVIIQFNGNPVGLEFNASGSFVRVLEQREGRDMKGRGYHEGGRFEDRDGRQRDTVAVTSLPSAILSYMSATYTQDTLLTAYRNRDSSYIVLSKNNGIFATVFSNAGNFISRVQLQAHANRVTSVAETALPSSAASYLNSTYPNFVFKKAFAVTTSGSVSAYIVVLEANSTKYAVQFNGSGSFVRSVTLR